MKKYGIKTRRISFSLILFGLLFVILSFFFRSSNFFEGILSLSAVFIFSGGIIYFVIYRQFEKLGEIAEDIDKD